MIVGVVVFAVHRVQRRRVPDYKQVKQSTVMMETSHTAASNNVEED